MCSKRSSKAAIFQEPLNLQRQRWLLQQIRQHDHDNVIEIGCGEGSLLRALLISPPWIDASPQWACWLQKCTNKTLKETFPRSFLSPLRVVGIDINPAPLQTLKAHFESQEAESYSGIASVSLVQADFRSLPSGTDTDFDILIASEVIEHLDEEALQSFCPTILGRLRPRVMLLTTPNYSFNINFENAESGYLDPTGRSDRVFRHDDHKFEWTRDEFNSWCRTNAELYGYTVVTSGVGRDDRLDPHDTAEEDEITFATQNAVFIRDDGSPSQRMPLSDKMMPSGATLYVYEPLSSSDDDGSCYREESILKLLIENKVREASTSQTALTIGEVWEVDEVKQECDYKLDNLLIHLSLYPFEPVADSTPATKVEHKVFLTPGPNGTLLLRLA